MSRDSIAKTDLDWMALRVEVLFEQDSMGRVLRPRESGSDPAPRFYVGRSRYGNVWRFRADLPADQVRDLARLAGREGPLADDHSPPERMQAFRNVLEREAPVTVEHRGPGFRFSSEWLAENEGREDDDIVEISQSNRRLLEEAFPGFVGERLDGFPCHALLREGRVVSQCCTARRLIGTGAEAGVETLPEARGCGYAPRVVSAWARAIARAGEVPFYSTGWDNAASRGVAQKLGLIFVGEDLHLR